jgi:threonine/homoserine/homoserine lactone efflux protein
MDPAIILTGLTLGFSIAAPVGPVGLLCIRRTLADGRASGFVSGLGAATADAFYGAIAGLGLAVGSEFLIGQQLWLRLIGGAFLLYLGFTTFRSKPAQREARAKGIGLLGAYGSTLALTLTNPLTILSFAAFMAGLGVTSAGSGYLPALVFIAGVFLGSAAWWLLLSAGVGFVRSRVTPQLLGWINRFSGAIIVAFGIIALAGIFK